MKKVLSMMLVAVMAMLMLGTVSKATTKNELKEYITSPKTIAGKTMVVQDDDKVRIERYFDNNEITDEQAGKIKDIMDKAISFMTANNASNPSQLSKANKQKLLAYAQEAASVLGLTVSYDSSTQRLNIFKDGKQIESLRWGKTLNQTGSTNYIYAVVAGVVLIAGITLVVSRKKLANAAA